MTLSALLFDVDGTLADTEETHRQAFNAAFLEFRLPYEWSRDRYEELLKVSGGKERLAHFFEGLPVSREERARLLANVSGLHRVKTERYAELVASGGSPLRPGIRRLVEEALAAGIRVGIASTTTSANVAALLDAELGRNAHKRFAVIACGDVVPAKKPAPDIYHLALSTLGLGPANAVAFEDSANGLAAAKAAGLYTVVTPTRWTAFQDFGEADLTLPHLGDPDHPLDSVSAGRVGGAFLTLEALARLHARAAARAA
ncbi:MAG: HAD-IA family hydrolase [Betaproteobacteria bacterium]|nr:HAD-IA family hydrolase [Betaproteobacteria bacterium]PWB58147.1 MAG: haloacid dehalogenase [Betaproteobacteria bacterium]